MLEAKTQALQDALEQQQEEVGALKNQLHKRAKPSFARRLCGDQAPQQEQQGAARRGLPGRRGRGLCRHLVPLQGPAARGLCVSPLGAGRRDAVDSFLCALEVKECCRDVVPFGEAGVRAWLEEVE